ncbi:MAG: DUF547 domain-containing protein [Myxococcales bacterium]|nr:DUF547 domain-containing protein [Myxococcales bacterium]
MTMRRAMLLGLVMVAMPAAAGAQDAGAAAVTAADVWSRYDALLRAVVRGDGVDYGALRARLGELRAIHGWLGDNGPTRTPGAFATAGARKAYWLNAYNATVLRGVAEAPATMRNVLTYLPDGGFFRARRWRLDGREMTLDAVENREVRPVFRDPRVHVALNCAARSCPPLRRGAYTAAGVEAQLDAQARAYVNAPGTVELVAAPPGVRVTQIFEWFGEDFAPGGGVVAWLRRYAAPPLRERLEAACGTDAGRCAVTWRPYDWTLNAAP